MPDIALTTVVLLCLAALAAGAGSPPWSASIQPAASAARQSRTTVVSAMSGMIATLWREWMCRPSR
ncbi:hypothetical protein B5181_08445 [Streptomyces sp. 4F]|nr:hypothetical protein B5181_08445 [Streptomyces sp. 4F]